MKKSIWLSFNIYTCRGRIQHTVLEKSPCQNLNRADTRTSAATHTTFLHFLKTGTQRARGCLIEPIKFEYANAVSRLQSLGATPSDFLELTLEWNSLWVLMMPRLAPEVRSNKKRCAFLYVRMHLAGLRAQAISESLRIPRRTVSFWINKFQAKGDVEDEKRSGRPRATSCTADQRLLRLCRANRFASSALLLAMFNYEVGPTWQHKAIIKAFSMSNSSLKCVGKNFFPRLYERRNTL